MNDLESRYATSREVISLGQQRGIDLGLICHSGAFLKNDRYIFFWRKNDAIHYGLQGRVKLVPKKFVESASAFYGMWDETGSIRNIEDAVSLVVAWLLDQKEVDELPTRSIRRQGIG